MTARERLIAQSESNTSGRCIFCRRKCSGYYNVDKFGFQPVCLGDPNDGWKHSCTMQVWNSPVWGPSIRANEQRIYDLINQEEPNWAEKVLR